MCGCGVKKNVEGFGSAHLRIIQEYLIGATHREVKLLALLINKSSS